MCAIKMLFYLCEQNECCKLLTMHKNSGYSAEKRDELFFPGGSYD